MAQTSEQMRKMHNDAKRQLIQRWVLPGTKVLDCGCGRGGDWHKWKAARVHVFAIDPDEESLREAEQRAHDIPFGVWFLGTGTIVQAAFAGPFDTICYNFSLQYIFEDDITYRMSLKAIACSLNPNGLLIGVVPEKARAEALVNQYGHFKDALGNEFSLLQGGRRLNVRLVDGPFYADGGREEPVLDATVLVKDLAALGLELVMWEPMLREPTGLISDLYSKFVFRKSR
jgi:SAM-dependent methyltransferase